MKYSIRNATIYSADLPSHSAMEKHLSEHLHSGLPALQLLGAGFTTHPVTNKLVTPIAGGFIFCLRFDQRLLPSSVITMEVSKRTKEIEIDQERTVRRKERQVIREEVLFEMLPKAFVLSRNIIGYYHEQSRRLIIDTSSKKLASIMVNRLILAVGSVKTSTIHISDIKHGLSTRLEAWLNDNTEAFTGFEVGEFCKMTSQLCDHKEVTINGANLADFRHDITDCLSTGYKVDSMLLRTAGVDFKLRSDFLLAGIQFDADAYGEDDFEDEATQYIHSASVELMQLGNAINKLCEMFEYQDEHIR